MNRDEMLARSTAQREPWDMVIIGGGATGMGAALDAASRGYRVLLVEQHDFGKGTSSRSTKLVHGGVRYLRQGNIALVREALLERDRLLRNAPHLVHALAFVIPSYAWWEKPYYAVGLHAYGILAGRLQLGRTRTLSPRQALDRLPTLRTEQLRGGIQYFDAQFDDARLIIALALSAAEHGATLLNYAPVVRFLQHASGRIEGVVFRDEETGQEHEARARVVINATGAFCDQVRRVADRSAAHLVSPSQGIHLVFDRRFLPGESALMVPRTRDGRVLFAIPWHGHTLVGTTDTPIEQPSLEPKPLALEIDFVLETLHEYLAHPPGREDVQSAFAGIRPLVRPREGTQKTALVPRDHTIHFDSNGLITITGGKWTTYRRMAEDVVNQAARQAQLPPRPCATKDLQLHMGADAAMLWQLVREQPTLATTLHPALPYRQAEVVWAARHEMARHVEDVLARRTRALFLNARAASQVAGDVAALLASELHRDHTWQIAEATAFRELALRYSV